MFCPNCGKEATGDVAYCPACGYRLIDETPQIKENATTDDVSSDAWYYLAANERKGPVTKIQIYDLIQEKVIDRDTLVWREGYSEWTKIENTIFNEHVQSTVPAVPVNAVSDKWLWALAVVPLLVNYVLANYVLVQYFPELDPNYLYMIVVGLNVCFCSLDVQYLKKCGINAETWLWLGIILVPVYLFVRAVKTTKNIVPGIVWCLLFELSLFV